MIEDIFQANLFTMEFGKKKKEYVWGQNKISEEGKGADDDLRNS